MSAAWLLAILLPQGPSALGFFLGSTKPPRAGVMGALAAGSVQVST